MLTLKRKKILVIMLFALLGLGYFSTMSNLEINFFEKLCCGHATTGACNYLRSIFPLEDSSKLKLCPRGILVRSLLFAIARLSPSEILPLTTLGMVSRVVHTRSDNLFGSILFYDL
jgi:hypothetical protein